MSSVDRKHRRSEGMACAREAGMANGQQRRTGNEVTSATRSRGCRSAPGALALGAAVLFAATPALAAEGNLEAALALVNKPELVRQVLSRPFTPGGIVLGARRFQEVMQALMPFLTPSSPR